MARNRLGARPCALANSPEPSYRLSQKSLAAYVAEFGSGQACVERVSNLRLPRANVGLIGNVAVVHPGGGVIALPAGVRAVVIDLRGLPNVPELREALDRAASLALATVTRASREGLDNFGYSNSDQSFAGIYSQFIDVWPDLPIPASAPQDLPLAVLTMQCRRRSQQTLPPHFGSPIARG